MKHYSLISLLILAGLISSCGPKAVQPTPVSITQTTTVLSTETPAATEELSASPTNTPAALSVSFTNDVMPILQSRCFNCHGGEQTKKGLAFTSYETLMAGSEDGLVVIPGDAAGSLLYKLVSEGKMPKRGPLLTPDQIQIIFDWILAGALDN